MCMCKTPNVNGNPGYSWYGEIGVRQPDPPEIKDNDVVLFDEPGRCEGIDSHCHHYTVVKNLSRCELLVRNGSGDKRIRLANAIMIVKTLHQLDSNGRYWLLNAINHAQSDAKQSAIADNDAIWRQAACEKRIKTRKIRNQNGMKVWIEPKMVLIK